MATVTRITAKGERDEICEKSCLLVPLWFSMTRTGNEERQYIAIQLEFRSTFTSLFFIPCVLLLFTQMFFICRNCSVPQFFVLLILLARLIHAQSPTAKLPAVWRLNQLEDHTYLFGESILKAILYRQVKYLNYVCGFYCEANCKVPRYSLSILIIAAPTNITPPVPDGYFNPSVVWSANRDNLVSANSVLELTGEGDLVLKDPDKGITAWSSGSAGKHVAGVNLTDIGNLLLFNQKYEIVWQSFDHPKDTLLVGQKLLVGKKLVPSVSYANYTEQGQFSLTMTTRGLDAIVGSKPQLSYYSFHWESSGNSYATLRHGLLILLQNDSVAGERAKLVINTNSQAVTAHYFRMDADGHLRAYGYNALGELREMGDMLPLQTCQYPTVCGHYGICSGGRCICPPPRDGVTYFSPVSARKPELGCSLNVPLACEDSKHESFTEIKDVTYFNFRVDIRGVDANGCRDACARNCSCIAAFFQLSLHNASGECFLPSGMFSLINVEEASRGAYNRTVFLKVQNRAAKMPGAKRKNAFLQKVKRGGLGVVIALAFLSCGALLFPWRNMRSNEETEDDRVEELLGMPVKFSYAELKSITDDFSQKLGEGGFGVVFKGTLQDGTKVAVKRLHGSRNMKEFFLNEVGTIGSIHHVNLVKLLGFCSEKSHRLLVYEYMSNGSLDKWIFENSSRSALDWEKRRHVILDVAEGLHYLHELCSPKIVHLDIKPQNILLDDNLHGKVSDFGLSKLVDREDRQVVTTSVRCTPGYLAPEWLNDMITERADAYSFGMVVVEIILGKKVADTCWGPEDMNLLKLLERKANEGRLMDLIEAYSNDVKLDESAAADVLTVMRIACWCLQTDFRNRPSMSTVIKVLDGVMEVKDDLAYDFSNFHQVRSSHNRLLALDTLRSQMILEVNHQFVPDQIILEPTRTICL